MNRSVITQFLASIRSTAQMLMEEQERSIVHSAVIADLRALPEYLQRDIGFIDGNTVVEGVSASDNRDAEPRKRWSDLVVTPHAA